MEAWSLWLVALEPSDGSYVHKRYRADTRPRKPWMPGPSPITSKTSLWSGLLVPPPKWICTPTCPTPRSVRNGKTVTQDTWKLLSPLLQARGAKRQAGQEEHQPRLLRCWDEQIPQALRCLSSHVVDVSSQGVAQARAASWEQFRGMIPHTFSWKLETE